LQWARVAPGNPIAFPHSMVVIPDQVPLVSGMFIEKYLKVAMQLIYQVGDL
jgi:hypothetical protein